MVRNSLHSLWNEPRASDPPLRVWRDWVLLAAAITSAVLEGTFREAVDWRVTSIIVCVVPAFLLLRRRSLPLQSLLVGFGVISLGNLGLLLGFPETAPLYSFAYVVVFSYAVGRWGSGREMIIGTVFVQLANLLSEVANYTGVGSMVGASAFALFPPLVGLAIRFWLRSQASEKEQLRLHEREQLARELHDTVAHHVSAIAVQAQAGQAVAASDPESAAEVLNVIEDAASRALAEMRMMVGALRDGDDAALAPQRGLADIEQLAKESNGVVPVTVDLSGELDDLQPAVGAAVYRLAQESITNALRHASNATRVDVAVIGDDDRVRLSVRDDGAHNGSGRGSGGFGLVGMTERATLLGGTFNAGPNPERGWTVTASLPKAGASA